METWYDSRLLTLVNDICYFCYAAGVLCQDAGFWFYKYKKA